VLALCIHYIAHMRNVLLIIFTPIALYDGFTTVLGTAAILGQTSVGILLSILFSLIILAFMLGTFPIWSSRTLSSNAQNKDAEGCLLSFIRFIWVAAFIYDIYTSYSGNKALVAGENSTSISQEIILVGLTLFISAAPIFVSYMLSSLVRKSEN